MSVLENDLSEALAELGRCSPVASGLVPAALRRSRQLRLRRRVAVGAVLAVAAGGGYATTSLPSAHHSPSLGTLTSASDFLVEAGDFRPSFPLTPGYLPDGVLSTPRIVHEPGNDVASWELLKQGQDGALSGVDVVVLAAAPAHEPGSVNMVDVEGRPATVRRGTGQVTVEWMRPDGQYVRVTASNTVATEAIALRVARSLTDAPIIQGSEVHLRFVPRGYVLTDFQPGGLLLAPRQGTSREGVSVAVRRSDPQILGKGEPVSVAGKDGWLQDQGGIAELVLKLADKEVLQVVVPSGPPWTRDELARFVSGVTYTGGVPRQEG